MSHKAVGNDVSGCRGLRTSILGRGADSTRAARSFCRVWIRSYLASSPMSQLALSADPHQFEKRISSRGRMVELAQMSATVRAKPRQLLG